MNEVLKNKIHVLSQLANVDKDFDIRELSFIYECVFAPQYYPLTQSLRSLQNHILL